MPRLERPKCRPAQAAPRASHTRPNPGRSRKLPAAATSRKAFSVSCSSTSSNLAPSRNPLARPSASANLRVMPQETAVLKMQRPTRSSDRGPPYLQIRPHQQVRCLLPGSVMPYPLFGVCLGLRARHWRHRLMLKQFIINKKGRITPLRQAGKSAPFSATLARFALIGALLRIRFVSRIVGLSCAIAPPGSPESEAFL